MAGQPQGTLWRTGRSGGAQPVAPYWSKPKYGVLPGTDLPGKVHRLQSPPWSGPGYGTQHMTVPLARETPLATEMIAYRRPEYGGQDARHAAIARMIGMLQPGNIDLGNRPLVRNPDGSISTVRSMGIGTDQGETLIPTVANGQVLGNEDAIQRYRDTGENLGTYTGIPQANRAAGVIHNQQGRYMQAVLERLARARWGQRPMAAGRTRSY